MPPDAPIEKALSRVGIVTKARQRPDFSDGTGLPIDEDAPEKRLPGVTFSDALGGLLKKFNIAAQNFGVDVDLLDSWNKIVGDDLASQTTPLKYENGVLFLKVRSSTALFEVRRKSLREIGKKVREAKCLANFRAVKLTLG